MEPGRPLAGLWRRADGSGLERFELCAADDGWRLSGTILARDGDEAFEARYRVHCDARWCTRSATVSLLGGGSRRELALTVADGRWNVDGREHPGLRGALDVDLAWSPSTNTLPIRRLDLPVGARSGPLVAAWVRFPELALEPLPQEYERLAERRYRYASRAGAFVALLEVDPHGLVLEYEGLWHRLRG